MSAPKFISTHLYFRREAVGTSSRTVKPTLSSADEVGIVADVSITPDYGREIVIEAPSPGHLEDYEVIQPQHRMTFALTVREVGQLFWELLHQTGELAPAGGSATFVPGAGRATKGWMKIEQYDHDDLLVCTVDLWSHVRIEPVSFGQQEVSWTFTGRKLQSAQNLGQLSNLI